MNDFEKQLFDIANSTVGMVLDNGDISNNPLNEFQKFSICVDNLDSVFPIWLEWIEATKINKKYSVEEEHTILTIPSNDKIEFCLLWKSYPTVKKYFDKYIVSTWLLIKRFNNDFSCV